MILSGQVTGISSVQYSGEPGADAADIYVRGVATWQDASPLIQVDGVERDMSQIDPNEIESITVLKDAFCHSRVRCTWCKWCYF